MVQSDGIKNAKDLLSNNFKIGCGQCYNAIATIKRDSSGGCGSVGRTVASDSRGPRFVSSHQQKFICNIYCQVYLKDENKEKEVRNGQFLRL